MHDAGQAASLAFFNVREPRAHERWKYLKFAISFAAGDNANAETGPYSQIACASRLARAPYVGVMVPATVNF
jgi:hypothetical protein